MLNLIYLLIIIILSPIAIMTALCSIAIIGIFIGYFIDEIKEFIKNLGDKYGKREKNRQ